jgi:beta-lactam-binding protein with PASTA domain
MSSRLYVHRYWVFPLFLLLAAAGCPLFRTTVPDVVGMTREAADSALAAADLRTGTVTEQFSETVPAGTVISQNPAAGTRVRRGSAVDLAVSKGPERVSVPDVVGMTEAAAEAALTTARLTVGNVTQEYHETVPAGTVISQNPAAGTSVAPGTAVDLVVSQGPTPSQTIHVEGRVVFDTGEPVEGAEVRVTLPPADFAARLQQAFQADAHAKDWTRPDFKANPDVVSPFASLLLQFLEPTKSNTTTTDADGHFDTEIVAMTLPARILIEVGYTPPNLPRVDTARWDTADTTALDVGRITIPNPEGAAISLTGGAGGNADGSLQVEGVPETVSELFGRTYDPDVTPEAFPGEFTEMAAIPLNSSVFVWMEALDAAGNPVNDLGQAATIRAEVPRTQWGDLEDTQAGTDRIEIPIYTYNEALNVWEQQGIGWLEDAARTVLPEDAESVILNGSFAGRVYATFATTHFSWMNVDYAYIGPWTLSRIDRNLRNNDCLYQAMQLAKTIALSAAGRAAYARVNQAGADLGTELADGQGPELKDSKLDNEYGVYQGDAGGSESQIEIAQSIWDGCGEGATEDQKKNTILIMAVTILHETAHWKDDVKKYPDDDRDTPGEEGNQLETDLFGGVITDGGGIKRDGNAVGNNTRDNWLNPNNWPAPPKGTVLAQQPPQPATPKVSALEVTISVPQTTFNLGEEIPVTVTYRNISSAAVRVMRSVTLEGWPLHFNIIKASDPDSGTRVRFLGPEFKRRLSDDDFVTLDPGQSLTLDSPVNLLRDPQTSRPQYQLIRSGTYEITAVYEALYGVAEAVSNTLTVQILGGGSISGVVTNATNGGPIAGATVRVLQNDAVLVTTTTDSGGTYQVPELPGGVFTVEVQAAGFLRTRQENVTVVAGQNTLVNFSLSPLLAQGELRLVLTWGQNPSDLDSHLWLPADVSYHVAYWRRGSLEECPFANLDTDDTSSYGPETITIRQRVRTGTYVYAVHHYSGIETLATSEAQVQVFDSSGLIAVFNVPTQGEGRWWDVCRIDGATGAITEVNQILPDPPEPYPDTDVGCQPPPPAK